MIGYNSFEADDIFFFAGEVDDSVETIDDFVLLLEKNLFPFFLLFDYSRSPKLLQGGHEIVNTVSYVELEDFEIENWVSDFRVEYNEGGYMGIENSRLEILDHENPTNL